MCGIFGGLSPNKLDSKQGLELLAHRGPDHAGTIDLAHEYDGRKYYANLSHRRLSIIDLSSDGNQPIVREDLNLSITFNGEIYNYQEIKKELLSEGFTFRSNSDTEVLLVGFAKYQEKILEKLRGMFAFGIFNQKNGTFFLARDRVGKKPLYYYIKDEILVFSSELKAIVAQKEVDKSIDNLSLEEYLSFGYISAPNTIYKYIKSLPSASFLYYSPGKNIICERYWRIDYSNKLATGGGIHGGLGTRGIRGFLGGRGIQGVQGIESITDELTNLFDESVKIRMLASDVPVGAFLSGGIDSSAVVAFASKYTSRLKTFSIKFNYSSFDESGYARLVAKKFNTDHHEFTVGADFINILPKIAWHFDQPFADSSALPTYYLSQMTSEHVKVVLSGDGGDESFVGYERYLAHALSEKYDLLPTAVKRVLCKIGESIRTTEPKTFFYRLKRILGYLSNSDVFDRYLKTIYYFNPGELSELFKDNSFYKLGNNDQKNGRTSNNYHLYFKDILASNNLEKIIGFDFERYLPDDLLVKVDRASMSHALEVRSPFLDHKIIEMAAALPLNVKFSRYRLKYLLKHKMLKNVIDHHILFRPKMGFGVPIHVWFKNEAYPFVRETLLSGKCINEFQMNKANIEKILIEHKENKANHASKLWSLLMLELWRNQQY